MTRAEFTPISIAFESLGQMVALLDKDLNIVEASPALRGLAGAPDIDGRSINDFIDAAPVAGALRQMKRFSAQCELNVPAGPVVAVSAAPIADGAFDIRVRYILALELREENGSADVT